MKTSKIIKELREDLNLSQQKLANFTGISQSAIACWELDQTEPTSSALCKLAEFFNVTTDYLLGRDEIYIPAGANKTEVQELYDQLSQHQQALILERMYGFIDGNSERADAERAAAERQKQYKAEHRSNQFNRRA